MRDRRAISLPVAAVIVLALLAAPSAGQPQESTSLVGAVTRVSVDSQGRQAQAGGSEPALSAHGRYVAFTSSDPGLVTGDTNREQDVFVRDRLLGTTVRVSVGSRGQEANGSSFSPSISASGRYIAFFSDANNLVPGQTGVSDAFVKDMVTNRLRIISGGESPDSGAGGVSPARISASGRFVAFVTGGRGVVPGDTNGFEDAFVRNLETGVTRRVSVSSDGDQANGQTLFDVSVSRGGRYVAYPSDATNLVPNDTNRESDIFVRDRRNKTTLRVSVGPNGRQANGTSFHPVVAANGRVVAFTGCATNLIPHDNNGRCDVFTHNLRTGVTRRVSVSTSGTEGVGGSSAAPSLSANARYVAFSSDATNLVVGDTNVRGDAFIRDRRTQETVRVSIGLNSEQSNGDVFFLAPGAMSADGRHLGFESFASNLVPGDTNDNPDVFVWDRFGDVAMQ